MIPKMPAPDLIIEQFGKSSLVWLSMSSAKDKHVE